MPVGVIGQRVRRLEDPRFLTGKGTFVDNMPIDNALHVTFVRSPAAHARITSIDTSGATAMPGTQVFTAAELGMPPLPIPPFLGVDQKFARPMLASDTVRFVGDIVAIVLTDSLAAGVDAAEQVLVEYETLPAVIDPNEALSGGVLLFPDVGSNVCLRRPGSGEDIFAGCDVVVSGQLVSQRMAACPLESRACAATFEDGRLTTWLSTQTPHTDRDGLAGLLGLDPTNVRVIAPDVGGGFGAKGLCVEYILLGWLAMHTGRPVRWAESRSENMVAMHHGRAQKLDFTIGGSRDGTLEAYRLNILQDAGAYPGIGAFLANLTAMMASGVYRIPKIDTDVTAVVTNTTQIAAFRGAGRPEATQAIERAVDLFATEIGMDPAEVRRRNMIPRDSFPFTTAAGATYDIGDYEGSLDRALAAGGYEQLRAEQQRRREDGASRQLGIGLSSYVEITNGLGESELGGVEITSEGGAIVRTGSFSHGQGHETTFATIVSHRLGVPVEKISVLKGDTDSVARGTGTYGSKSTQIGGAAAEKAAGEVLDRAREIVADMIEASPEDVVLDRETGRLQVAGAPQSGMSWPELAGRLDGDGRLAELTVETEFQAAAPTFPFGTHLSVVEVDLDTGHVEALRHIAVDDAGTLINPLVAEGQVHGGVATGIAQALYEEVQYDEDGNPVSGSFVSYAMPAATEIPDLEIVEMQTPTPMNVLGAKGIGESGTIGATPAVQNAVIDALAHMGVRHIDMPANGERVWRAIQEAQGS